MNPPTLPLELIYIEARHEEMIRQADQHRLANEALEGRSAAGKLVQGVRALLSRADRTEDAAPTTKSAASPATRRKVTPRTA